NVQRIVAVVEDDHRERAIALGAVQHAGDAQPIAPIRNQVTRELRCLLQYAHDLDSPLGPIAAIAQRLDRVRRVLAPGLSRWCRWSGRGWDVGRYGWGYRCWGCRCGRYDRRGGRKECRARC